MKFIVVLITILSTPSFANDPLSVAYCFHGGNSTTTGHELFVDLKTREMTLRTYPYGIKLFFGDTYKFKLSKLNVMRDAVSFEYLPLKDSIIIGSKTLDRNTEEYVDLKDNNTLELYTDTQGIWGLVATKVYRSNSTVNLVINGNCVVSNANVRLVDDSLKAKLK